MALIAKSGGDGFKQVDPGTYHARCFRIVDLGTQRGEWQGKPTVRRQVILQWELPTEIITIDGEDKPATISKFYTLSLNEKSNLRPDLEAWRGRAFSPEEEAGFDLVNVLDKTCMVSVVHDEKGKAKVASVAKVMKGATLPPAYNPLSMFSLDDYDDNAFAALPDGFKRIIEKSDEYKALNQRAPSSRPPAGTDPDDIPF